MAGFKFQLQQVLDYRGQLKEQAQVVLARVLMELTREQERITEIRASLEANERRLYTLNVSEAGERWLLEHFVKGLRSDEASAHRRVAMLMQERDSAQAELARRALDEKVLEKLKEKRAERHAAEERLKEMKNYDETAAIRFKPASY